MTKYKIFRHGRARTAPVSHRWEDGREIFCVGHSTFKPGKVFYQTFRVGQADWPGQQGVWFVAPDWVYAAIGEADDMAGVLDWLVERFPDHGRLHDAVRRVAAAGLTVGGVPA